MSERSFAIHCEQDRGELLPYLIDLAVKGLVRMFDANSQLFCYRVKKTDRGMINEGLSLRYTVISLLGLHRYELHGNVSPIHVQKTLKSLFDRRQQIDNLGDLGLLLWLGALAAPEQLIQFYSKFDCKEALRRYQDAQQGRTMELAWFLTGLAYLFLTTKGSIPELKDLANQTYNVLLTNHGSKGIFGHLSAKTSAGLIRGRVGSFADQVYPIYALSKFGSIFGNMEALAIALDCAKTICRLQGSLGQWWWHYHSLTGKVVGQYPVYSVHQDGMAPMALFAVGDATGQDFSEPIYKGLRWIVGCNELERDLTDTNNYVIWRSFYMKNLKMYYDAASSLFGLSTNQHESKNLLITWECRPYHFGWLLYAFAGVSKKNQAALKS
jgi:hypothetical protein